MDAMTIISEKPISLKEVVVKRSSLANAVTHIYISRQMCKKKKKKIFFKKM